jgi:hypothetical protein
MCDLENRLNMRFEKKIEAINIRINEIEKLSSYQANNQTVDNQNLG